MNAEQLKSLTVTPDPGPKFWPDDLSAHADRVLLYGYTCDRYTWEVGTYEGQMYRIVYSKYLVPTVKDASFAPFFYMKDMIPNKRLYPARCDFETCQVLMRHGLDLPFTDRRACDLGHVEQLPNLEILNAILSTDSNEPSS